MAADVLVTQGARASATMILTLLNRDYSVPARWGLKALQNADSVNSVPICEDVQLPLTQPCDMAMAVDDMERTSYC